VREATTELAAMTMPAVLVATWNNGLFVVADGRVHHEFAGQPVKGLTSDGRGGALAIVGNASLRRRSRDGSWSTIAEGEFGAEVELACCVAVGTAVYVGTDDAHVLCVRDDGRLDPVPAFDRVSGREKWYSGSAVIDGRVVGPPLGVRSITATCDHTALLVNVHVGGIPRSHDEGASWQPTIDIDSDVHQVCAHPTRPDVVAAAAGAGLCISRDGGKTWAVERQGLHACYCSAVAFAGDDVLVAASTDHFASQGAIYRRRVDGSGPILPVGGGLPGWIDGIADTGNVAATGSAVAVVDRSGNLYQSADAGHTWTHGADQFAFPSSVFVY
jgi:hypothetical protein